MTPDRHLDDLPIDPAHEDVLRAVLQKEALTVDPSLDPADITSRTDRRAALARARSHSLMGLAAAATVAVVVLALSQRDDGRPEVIDTVDETTTTVADDVTPPTPLTVTDAPGIFPFHTGAEADAWYEAWSGDAPADELGSPEDLDPTDPASIAESFAVDFLGMTDGTAVDVRQGDSSSWEVDLQRRQNGPVTTLFVRRLGVSPALTVTGAVTANISLDEPAVFDSISSPVTISGTSTAYEATVLIQIRADGMTAGSKALAVAPLMGGANGELGPLTGTVAFPPSPEPFGTVVALTTSAADGVVEEAAVVRVAFADGPPRPGVPTGDALALDELVAARYGGGSWALVAY